MNIFLVHMYRIYVQYISTLDRNTQVEYPRKRIAGSQVTYCSSSQDSFIMSFSFYCLIKLISPRAVSTPSPTLAVTKIFKFLPLNVSKMTFHSFFFYCLPEETFFFPKPSASLHDILILPVSCISFQVLPSFPGHKPL